MSALDEKVDRAADKLAELSRAAARAGGLRAKLAEPLADDSEFLRQLKPSLIAARARGEAPTDGQVTTRVRLPAAEAEPSRRPRPRPPGGGGASEGPNPLLVIGAALMLGIALAHVLAWLGHRYPRV